jgi:hypothetical protein
MSTVLNVAQAPLPIWNVMIDGQVANLLPSKLLISQSPGQHENAQLTCQMPSLDYSQYVNKTITFQWGPDQTTFTGWVRQTTNSQDYQAQPYLTLDCMGVTWQMAGGTPAFFRNTTVPDLVTQIVKGNGLGCVVDDHPYVWPRLTQTTESDWSFINSLADRIGYYLIAINGAVRLMDPIAALDNNRPVANLAKASNILNSQLLLDFSATSVRSVDRAVQPPKIGYFKEDGTVQFVNGPAKVFSSDYFVPGTARADLLTRVTARDMSAWIFAGQARVKGTTSLHPGLVVNIITGGSDALTNTGDGLWFIAQTVHSIDANTYQTQLGLARDADRFDTQGAATFWGGTNHSRPDLIRVNGRWTSTWRNQ